MKEWPQFEVGDKESTSLGPNEYFGDKDGPIHIIFTYEQDKQGRVLVHTFISARHRGDEAVKHVEEELAAKALQLQKPIIDQVCPWNDPATKLYRRHGYQQVGVTKYGSQDPIYEKQYPIPLQSLTSPLPRST